MDHPPCRDTTLKGLEEASCCALQTGVCREPVACFVPNQGSGLGKVSLLVSWTLHGWPDLVMHFSMNHLAIVGPGHQAIGWRLALQYKPLIDRTQFQSAAGRLHWAVGFQRLASRSEHYGSLDRAALSSAQTSLEASGYTLESMTGRRKLLHQALDGLARTSLVPVRHRTWDGVGRIPLHLHYE